MGADIFVISGLKWAAVARHGLILLENEATGFKIIFFILFGPRRQQHTLKHVIKYARTLLGVDETALVRQG